MIQRILSAMDDDESRLLFSKKIESIVLRDPILYRKALLETDHSWKLDKTDDLSSIQGTSNPICIFGAGYFGKLTYLLLKKLGLQHRVVAFIDNDSQKQGGRLYNLEVKSFFDIDINALRDMLFLIAANPRHAGEIYVQLMKVYAIPLSHIICPRGGYLRGRTGQQYFDVFSPVHHEVFVDAGASYGDTSVAFARWSKGNYDGIYAFDPRKNADNYYSMIVKKERLRNAHFFAKGLWCSNTTLHFSENASASRIETEGTHEIQVASLDEVLSRNRVTFIKMDIEGAELEALKGSEYIIRKWRPRLAISIYHKSEDIVAIPSYILQLDSSYKFIIRTYCSNGSETVLYAFPI